MRSRTSLISSSETTRSSKTDLSLSYLPIFTSGRISAVTTISAISPGTYFFTSTWGMDTGVTPAPSNSWGIARRTAKSSVWEARSFGSTCCSTTFAGALPLRKPGILISRARRSRAFRRAGSKSPLSNSTVNSTDVLKTFLVDFIVKIIPWTDKWIKRRRVSL